MRPKIVAWIPLLLLFFLSGAWAQSIRTDEVIQRLKESRSKTRDLSADLVQEKKIALLKEKIVSKGTIRYRYPDKISIEFYPPDASRVLFDGKTLFLYYPEQKLAERYHASSHPLVGKYLLLSQDPFQEGLAHWKIIEDHAHFLVMEGLPQEKDFPLVRARFWISKSDWMITAMEIVEENGDTTLLRYSNIRPNSGVTDSDFEIHLPKDVKIVDVK